MLACFAPFAVVCDLENELAGNQMSVWQSLGIISRHLLSVMPWYCSRPTVRQFFLLAACKLFSNSIVQFLQPSLFTCNLPNADTLLYIPVHRPKSKSHDATDCYLSSQLSTRKLTPTCVILDCKVSSLWCKTHGGFCCSSLIPFTFSVFWFRTIY